MYFLATLHYRPPLGPPFSLVLRYLFRLCGNPLLTASDFFAGAPFTPSPALLVDDLLLPAFALLPHSNALMGALLPYLYVPAWEDALQVEIGFAASVVRKNNRNIVSSNRPPNN